MKKYRVEISPTAYEELNKIWGHIFFDSQNEDIADAVLDSLKNFCINKLSFFPEIGTRKDFLEYGIRFFPIDSYGLYYFFDGETVYVAHIVHQSQDIRIIF